MLNWDWETKEKFILDINEYKEKFSFIHDFVVSSDGEKLALVIETEDKKLTLFINGERWNSSYERICYLSFLPNNSVACLVLQNYNWTLSVNEKLLDETFDYAWNLQISKDASTIAFNIKKDNFYGVCVNGKVWENLFFDARDLFISPDGSKTASYVRTKNPPVLDIFSFKEGVWSLAVDGIPWDKNFISIYGCNFSPNSEKVSATVRLDQQEFSVAVDGKIWDETFLYAWEPLFIDENNICVPVKTEEGFTMVVNGKKIWNKHFVQLWHQRVSPDKKKIAAVVATDFGKWTVAVDGIPWKRTFSQAVLSPHFSPDSKKVASVVRENNKWTVAVDGIPWEQEFDRVWSPSFSPDGSHVLAKAEKDGVYFIVLDGKVGKESYDLLWQPQFSPDGEKILVRCIKNGRYYRKILTIGEVLG
ncbi:MAG: electron transfer complex subunit TmcD [Thermodesulfovibrio sp.]